MYDLRGGPFHGAHVELATPSTTVFRVGDVIGRYVTAYALPTTELQAHAAALDMQWRRKRHIAWHYEARQLHWQSFS